MRLRLWGALRIGAGPLVRAGSSGPALLLEESSARGRGRAGQGVRPTNVCAGGCSGNVDAMSGSRDFITIVSGVPRSGTSLAMHMLQAGGVPALTDGKRVADEHNPQGYFEYEAVKRLAVDSSWVPLLARGKSLKVIYRLLPHLPSNASYRLLFMERDWHEVAASQRTMLEARGDPAANQPEAKLIAAMSSEVVAVKAWMEKQPNIRALNVPYGALVDETLDRANAIAEFLGGGLDVAAMCGVVDPQLRRQGRSQKCAHEGFRTWRSRPPRT